MANNKSLHKAIERCDKRIAKAENKKRWASKWKDKEKAIETIAEQESKKLLLQQQISFNSSTKQYLCKSASKE